MSERRSINPTDLKPHKNPIPAASVKNGYLFTSAIMGYDPNTGRLANSKEGQIELAFRGLASVLREANMSPDDVVKVDLFFADKADRPLANEHWLNMFPDPASRPARHSSVSVLPPDCVMQISACAVSDA